MDLPAPSAPLDLEDLAGRVRAALEQSTAPATRRAYLQARRIWGAWCAPRELEAWPPAPEQVALWLVDQVEGQGLSLATARQRAVGLGWWARAAGLRAPLASEGVRRVLAGLERQHGTPQRHAPPLRLAELRDLAQDAGPAAARDRALLLIGWCAALRRSEIAALQLADVAEVGEGLELTIRRSKGDQAGAGAVLGAPRGRTAALCPVAAWDRWIGWRGAGAGAAFLAVDRWANLGGALSPRAVGELLRRYGYTGHSLRVGFAVDAGAAGASLVEIQAVTRHRSVQTVARYVRAGRRFLDHPAADLL